MKLRERLAKQWAHAASFVFAATFLAACGEVAFENTPWRDLQVGESYTVTTNRTSLRSAFQMAKPEDGVFQLYVPVDFRRARTESTTSLPDIEIARMVNITNRCLAVAERTMLNEDGTVRLRVRVAPGAMLGIPGIPVEITMQLVRGHARLWRTTWGCAEVVHEVMHLAGGLVDEYPEPAPLRPNESQRYGCRAVGVLDSIMFDPKKAYEASSPRMQPMDCHCQGLAGARGASCDTALEAMTGQEQECPADTLTFRRDSFAVLDFPDRTMELQDKRGGRSDRSILIVQDIAARRPSLLFPAQFRVLAYPNHPELNTNYYMCAANAYRSAGNCGPSSSICGDPTWTMR